MTFSHTRTDQASFMARIHQSLGRAKTPTSIPPAPPVDPSLARLTQPTEDLQAVFCKNAQAMGMFVHQVSAADMEQALIDILKEEKVQRMGVVLTAYPRMPDVLRQAGIDVPENPSIDAQFELDAGLTDVHAAIAETGTLVCCSDAKHSRGLSLVVPLHVAVVKKSQIMADLIDYWDATTALSAQEMSASIALITGPSKTADIEGILVTGVHGPGKVHVLVIEDQ